MLGGSVAGTAVAWAIASGTASADDDLGLDLGIGQRATGAVQVVQDTVDSVTDAVPGKQRATEAIDAMRSPSFQLAQRPLSLPGTDAAEGVVNAIGSDEESAESPAAVAAAQKVATEVAAMAVRVVPAPDGTDSALSPRAASGVDGPEGGADDVPPAHSPAPAPPVPAPVAAAGGCAAGSSLFPALIGQFPMGDFAGGVPARVVTAAECGRPDTTGSQPGTSPD